MNIENLILALCILYFNIRNLFKCIISENLGKSFRVGKICLAYELSYYMQCAKLIISFVFQSQHCACHINQSTDFIISQIILMNRNVFAILVSPCLSNFPFSSSYLYACYSWVAIQKLLNNIIFKVIEYHHGCYSSQLKLFR